MSGTRSSSSQDSLVNTNVQHALAIIYSRVLVTRRLNLNIFKIITSHRALISPTILVSESWSMTWGTLLHGWAVPKLCPSMPRSSPPGGWHKGTAAVQATSDLACTDNHKAWKEQRRTGALCWLSVLTAGKVRENPVLTVWSGEANTRSNS